MGAMHGFARARGFFTALGVRWNHMRWMLVLLFLLVAVVSLAPMSQAQFDPPPGTVAVDVEMTPAEAALEGADATQTFTITVTNSGENNPFPVAGEVVLTVSAPPDGWSFTLAEDTFQLEPGDDATTTLTIDPTQAADEESFTITVTATITYDLTFEQFTASDSATAQVDYTKGALAGLQDRLGGSVLWLALLGLVALVIIVVIATTRGGGIAITAPQHHIEAPPGSVVEVPLTIQNKGRRDDHVTLGVGRLPKGWNAGLDDDAITVPGRGTGKANLKVLMPKDASGRVAVSLAAHSQQTGKGAELHLTVEAVPKKG